MKETNGKIETKNLDFIFDFIYREKIDSLDEQNRQKERGFLCHSDSF